ncbi:uncharacterized protein LAESUDRAFT_718778 [Laetiporus sulphureus 93-53]|uniref:PIN domain-containing protein n=1 Tax=Laetiporus sulphureus 93-53 TaxID=1314785 RepID=A0A165I2U3_9APHY|nr:uncharacterized protein LAESUDRAFT_718778 [Laetiporus sulphureus 93-53]KZT12517.1 hypothetical protein LAESUDRAFT_718778 [Laetiporus sulphureus 93-53]
MEDAFLIQRLFLVLDTNVLIDYIDIVRRFDEDVEALQLPLTIIIPSVMLSELDGLKKRTSVGWFASRASAWILNRMKERKTVKVQARKETMHTEIGPEDEHRRNDMLIRDCCLYFQTKGHVVLLSGDVNLCNSCEAWDIQNICITTELKQKWTSHDLAQRLLGGYGIDTSRFRGINHNASYRPSAKSMKQRITVTQTMEVDDDSMDIDDAPVTDDPEEYIPSHALDALHQQVIDHFTLVLKDLALRVRTGAGDVSSPTVSKHAPGHRRKEFGDWSVGDCLEYLDNKKPLRVTQPTLYVFLLRRNEDKGWRRGQDWSRQDWENAMGALKDISIKFEDGALLGSLDYLKAETDRVFSTPLRPTGA